MGEFAAELHNPRCIALVGHNVVRADISSQLGATQTAKLQKSHFILCKLKACFSRDYNSRKLWTSVHRSGAGFKGRKKSTTQHAIFSDVRCIAVLVPSSSTVPVRFLLKRFCRTTVHCRNLALLSPTTFPQPSALSLPQSRDTCNSKIDTLVIKANC